MRFGDKTGFADQNRYSDFPLEGVFEKRRSGDFANTSSGRFWVRLKISIQAPCTASTTSSGFFTGFGDVTSKE